jgi:hypothetical protein
VYVVHVHTEKSIIPVQKCSTSAGAEYVAHHLIAKGMTVTVSKNG